MQGESTVLTAIGASSYSWSNGASSAAITVSPLSNTRYRVTGSNGVCSDTASVLVQVVTSGKADINAPKIRLFPNPINGSHNLLQVDVYQIQPQQEAELSIMGLTGQEILPARKLRHGKQEINLVGLASGIYAVRIQSAGGIQMLRLVVK